MRRRDFLATVGAMTGYSVLVRVDDEAAAGERSVEEIRREFDRVAPPGNLPAAVNERNMKLVELSCDVLVAGGGMAGVCAAVTAARHGAKVVLVQDRSRLGGNASSEVKMHVVGADCSGGRLGWREGGLLEEIRLDDAVNNPQRCFELWDLLLYDKVISEPNITLLLDSTLYAAQTQDGLIRLALVRCDRTEHIYRIQAKIFCDCSGDCRLGLEAGADIRVGREAKHEFNEPLALAQADDKTLGSSILFTARDHNKPMPFVPPKWARRITEWNLRFRRVSSWEYGYWWIEWGGSLNCIRDNERIRFELLSIVLGVWNYIKNSGQFPSSANWALDWVGMLPGKRGSRRLLGDHVLTQLDLQGQSGDLADAVAIGGWNLDDHPPGGFDDSERPPFVSIRLPDVYSIPLRSLYSRNIRNLLMAGRNISATHVAFTSTRVMATCAVEGQAIGTAAALCIRHQLWPRQLYENKERLFELQQTLLRDDQTIKGRRNEDPRDLARQARVTASAEHEGAAADHVLNGFVRDRTGKFDNKWAAPLTEHGAWLELSWDQPQPIRQLQLTFDSGFHRKLTLTSEDRYNRGMIRAAQPETVRDYTISIRRPGDKNYVEMVQVRGNHQRLRRHDFEPVKADAVRLHVQASNGDKLARLFEIRCYA